MTDHSSQPTTELPLRHSFASQVESVLLAHPWVAEVAVLGVPDQVSEAVLLSLIEQPLIEREVRRLSINASIIAHSSKSLLLLTHRCTEK